MVVHRERVMIANDAGYRVEAVAPVIVSASRATDIPACYADWFFFRLRCGHLAWRNPFSGRVQYVSFAKTRAIVFWTKNAGPILPLLPYLDKRGIHFYFQFTLNDYGPEQFEPGLPGLDERIGIFLDLSRQIGKDRVIWRFDPVLVTDRLCVGELLTRIKSIGDRLAPYTEKIVFSFIDIARYASVARNASACGIRELTADEMEAFAAGLARLNERWNLSLATCGESVDLSAYGIGKNRCIDGDLLARLFPQDAELAEYLRQHPRKDPGQRKDCGCIASKDIGEYGTCPNLCVYCYANRSRERAVENFRRHGVEPEGEMITGVVPGGGEQINS
ncbi:MAG: DUF1848 domain-containing protein [Methanoregula sp.]|jgi:hypothetical protein